MPRLSKFRLERKFSSEKVHKHSINNFKHKPHVQFAKLFQNSDVVLPSQLQNFLSRGLQIPDSEISRNISNKVRVVLKINECRDTSTCLAVNKNQNCVGLIDPTPSRRSQTSNTSVNLFPFDSILTDNDSPNFLFTDALIDPMLDFIKGRDSCLFSFGHAGLGKTRSMIGTDQSMANMGIIPCALAWTFKMIDFLKRTTNYRYSVRISAVEVSSKNLIRDLLADCSAEPRSSNTSLLQDKSSTILTNQRELPANSLMDAAHILDAALATRSNDNESLTHLQMIIHLYQYRRDNATATAATAISSGTASTLSTADSCNSSESNNSNAVIGERSRLYLLDLGSGRHGNEDQKILSLQGISKVILALYTSQRHLPYKENVLTQLLKDTLNSNISTTMLLHISSKEQNYSETLQVVQLAYKLYRMRLKKYRSVGFSVSDEASSCSSSSSGFQSRRLRPHMGIGAARRSSGNSSASSEFDLTSASELSCCETVIYKGDPSNNTVNKSPDRLSGKRKLRSVSSESDNAFSDKDTSKSLSFSSGIIASTSILRRRRASLRTNARAWPTSNDSLNANMESGSELWVDGPNAVYKVEHLEKQLQNNFLPNPIMIKRVPEPVTEIVAKPIMVSKALKISNVVYSKPDFKETQCDDVWDSGSSITDGSSHSNTLDRKEHRPLSDISECTEETESNLAVESKLVKMNMIDQSGPSNDLDDLLESTFGLSPMHQGNQFKPLSQTFLNAQNMADAQIQFLEKMTNPIDMNKVESSGKSIGNSDGHFKSAEPIIEDLSPTIRDLIDVKKNYHSASDSKRSSKSENKGKKTKTRCKKCSKKALDNRSKSMSSSNSTDFSRVASWIENVEHEIQSSKSFKSDNITKPYVMGKNISHMHHHSQPDISYQHEFFNANRSHLNPLHCQYSYVTSSQWLPNDSHQAQYSLYDGYNMTLVNPPSMPASSASHSNAPYLPVPPATTQIPFAQHMAPQQDKLKHRQSYHMSPKSGRARTHLSNISLPINSVSVNQLPLPPLPKSSIYVDTHVSLEASPNTPCPYSRPQSTSPIPVPLPVPPKPKCKTLPRDIYSDSVSPHKRNKSDFHSSKTVHAPSVSNEFKPKNKSKKEPSKIMSMLFAPFINLRKKINKSKTTSDTVERSEDVDKGKPSDSKSESRGHHLTTWSSVEQKLESSLALSSPYRVVTHPKAGILPTESSGHGSDSSSLHNRELIKSKANDSSRKHQARRGSMTHCKNFQRQRPTSSGYGSIIIKGDSEVSSHNDSSSEYSLSGLTNSKVVGGHGRLKHSVSLSNYKSIIDQNAPSVSKNSSTEISGPTPHAVRDVVFNENVKIAEDLIVQEKLKMSLKEERKIVIQLIETNRLRGVPIDPSVMNLICFKCVDNFDVNGPTKRNECEQLIEKIDQEIELLKPKLIQAQHHLFLITSFDCHPQPQ